MSEQKINFSMLGRLSIEENQVDVEVFDPPMCCSTGLCGPTQDQALIDLTETLSELQKEGYRVERYQMTTHPQAFLGNPEVMRLVREKELTVLPIVVVRGKILTQGRYPNKVELSAQLKWGK